MDKTTVINPGAFQSLPRPSLQRILYKTLRFAKAKRFRTMGNMWIAEGLNYLREVTTIRKKSKVNCSICNYKGPFFYHHYGAQSFYLNSICPKCNSRSRHRGLIFLYKCILPQLPKNSSILHFAPEPIFYSLFRQYPNINYKTADYFISDVDYKVDIQHIDLQDSQFDLILCNHVIEHVPDDHKAFSELSRILKKNGCALITIPGDFTKDRTRYFSHLKFNGHYRHYGLDVVQKMQKNFKFVKILHLSEMYDAQKSLGMSYGIRKHEYAFLCHNGWDGNI